jgi:hypothetical protein
MHTFIIERVDFETSMPKHLFPYIHHSNMYKAMNENQNKKE